MAFSDPLVEAFFTIIDEKNADRGQSFDLFTITEDPHNLVVDGSLSEAEWGALLREAFIRAQQGVIDTTTGGSDG